MTDAEEFAALANRDWRDMKTAPRDGTVVLLTWMHNGKPQEIFPMQWQEAATNDFFAPGVTGMWVLPGGGATWTEHDLDGAPTHWAPEYDS